MRVEFPNCRVADTLDQPPRPHFEGCVTPGAYDGFLAARRRSSAYSACSLAILHSNSLPRACRKPCAGVSSTQGKKLPFCMLL